MSIIMEMFILRWMKLNDNIHTITAELLLYLLRTKNVANRQVNIGIINWNVFFLRKYNDVSN